MMAQSKREGIRRKRNFLLRQIYKLPFFNPAGTDFAQNSKNGRFRVEYEPGRFSSRMAYQLAIAYRDRWGGKIIDA